MVGMTIDATDSVCSRYIIHNMNHSCWILMFFISITAFNRFSVVHPQNIVKEILRIAYLYEKIWRIEKILIFLHR